MHLRIKLRQKGSRRWQNEQDIRSLAYPITWFGISIQMRSAATLEAGRLTNLVSERTRASKCTRQTQIGTLFKKTIDHWTQKLLPTRDIYMSFRVDGPKTAKVLLSYHHQNQRDHFEELWRTSTCKKNSFLIRGPLDRA